jgi:hypothetical protein
MNGIKSGRLGFLFRRRTFAVPKRFSLPLHTGRNGLTSSVPVNEPPKRTGNSQKPARQIRRQMVCATLGHPEKVDF